MNVVQIVRKARLGCDAILPGNAPSTLWHDDELIELANEARDEIDALLRLGRRGYGMQTVQQSDAAFTRAGITYTPATALQLSTGQVSSFLPPDFAEIARILCTDNTTIRFLPGEYASPYWIELEQGAREIDGSFSDSGLGYQTIFYDLIGDRTLAFTPPIPAAMKLKVDYFPIKRLLVYSTTGTVNVTNGLTSGTVTSGTLLSDGLYTASASQAAELIAPATSPVTLGDVNVRLDREYPIVASIASNTAFTLEQPWAGTTLVNQPFLMAMAPTGPAPVHRTIAALMSAKMLRKVSAELAGQYATGVKMAFAESIRPSTNVRQSQDSRETDDNMLLGM